MFRKISNGCVHMVNRFLPDPFIFCIILTVIVFVASMPATGMGPIAMIGSWGTGIWGLLEFSMQMALVLVLGSTLAQAKVVKGIVSSVAGLAKGPKQGIVVVTFFSLVACWINWGFGLVVGAILAKEIARQVKGIDYRLLIASAYSGFVIWILLLHADSSVFFFIGFCREVLQCTAVNTGFTVRDRLHGRLFCRHRNTSLRSLRIRSLGFATKTVALPFFGSRVDGPRYSF